jgi:hypothetical protein
MGERWEIIGGGSSSGCGDGGWTGHDYQQKTKIMSQAFTSAWHSNKKNDKDQTI